MNHELDDIFREYKLKQTRALEDARRMKEEIYNVLPEVKEIDRDINQCGINIAKAVLDSESVDLENLRNKLDSLNSRKKSLLESRGYSLEDFNIKYECPECKDTGYKPDGTRCSCLKKAIIKNLYSNSNIGPILEEENFKNFDIDIFSDEVNEEYGMSPKENMHINLSAADAFCYNHKKQKGDNLILFGSTGLGKTYLSNCIAKFYLDRGFSVVYLTAFQLFDIISDRRFTNFKEPSETVREKYNAIFECDLLIIDDLGAENANSFTISELFNIINTRIISEKRTIISTNLTPKKLSENYTDRIFSRISNYYEPLYFFGKDLRWEAQRKRD